LEQHRDRLSGAAYIMGFRRGTTIKNGQSGASGPHLKARRFKA
jgi:hypothetical protein